MLRIVPHTSPRVGSLHEYFPDEFELHLLHIRATSRREEQLMKKEGQKKTEG